MNEPSHFLHTGKTAILIAIMIVIGFIAYSNAFHAAFVFDDHYFIVDDKAVHISELNADTLQTAAIEGKPRHRYLPNISFAVNYYFDQLNPFGYHVVNLAIHLLTGIFLFLFLKSTLQIYPRTFSVGSRVYPRPEREGINPSPTMTEKIINTAESSPELIAFCAALLWLVQPVGTQAVTYICQRMASMVAMFYILSLLLYVKGRMAMMKGDHPPRHSGRGSEATETRNPDACPGKFLVPFLYFTGCALAALCAFATKENAGTLPIVILLYEWFFFQDLKLQWSRRQLLWAGIFVLIFLAGVFWYMGENPFNRLFNSYNRRDFTMIERVMTELRIVVYYISLFLWAPPGRLNLDHDYPLSLSPLTPATTFPAFLAIIALLWLSVYTAKKHRLLAFAVLWFFLTQATESTIIGIELIFEHRTYLPFMMVSLMLVLMVFRFMREGIKPSPTSTEATPSPRRGGVYPRPGEDAMPSPALPNPDKPHLRLSLHQTAPWCLLLAIAAIFSFWTWQRNTDWKDPVTFWTDSVQKSPNKWRPNYNLGKTFQDFGDINGAILQYQKSVALHPQHIESLNNLAALLLQKDRTDEAVSYLQKIVRLSPSEFIARVNLANGFMKQGRIEEAVKQYKNALQLSPHHREIHINLGRALVQQDNLEAATDHFVQALRLNPNDPFIHHELANILVKKSQVTDAIYHYEKAIINAPGFSTAIHNRDALLSALRLEDRVAVLFKTGLRFAGEKEFKFAIGQFKKILAITPENPLIYYNISCLYAIQNQRESAIDWLKQAVDHGYDNWGKLKNDPDMDHIKNDPYFQKLTGAFGTGFPRSRE